MLLILCVYTSIGVAIASAPDRTSDDYSLDELIVRFAKENEVSPALLKKVMLCESHGNMELVGDGNRALGIYQYHEPTWEEFTSKMGEDLNRDSAYDQIKVTAWAFSNGYAQRWTAYRAIMNGGTYSFYSKLLKKHFTVKCK